MRFMSVPGGLVASLIASVALAAPTTPEQAQTVKTGLERYLGGDAASSPVSVTPAGDHLAIAFDLKRALRGLEPLGLTIEAASSTMDAAPQDDGLWHVTSAGVPRLTVKLGAESYSVVMNGMAFDGMFNPQLPGFTTSSLTYDSMSIAATGGKGGTQTREIHRGKQTSTATPAGEGAADVRVSQSNDGFSQDVTLDKTTGMPGTISIKSAATSATVSFEALRSRALTDLWAFLVALPSATPLKAVQADLRPLLKAALPLFDRWTQSGSAEQFSVTSPVGLVTLNSIGGQIRATGLVAQGQIESELHFDGLGIPTGVLPAWSDGLVPVSAEIKESFSGFHLDEAARQAIDSFDLEAKDPLPPAVLERMRNSLGGLDQMVVVLAPSHIASKLLDLRIDGDGRLRNLTPDFRLNIRATGLDKVLQDIQARGAGDETASQVLAGLVLAKGLGKAEPDGSLSWAVTTDAAGHITVNGLALPGSDK